MARSTQEKPFRVAVVGGGIAGLFATLSIHQHCSKEGVPIKIDVYEGASEYKEIGASISLGVNSARLIHHLGLGPQLNPLGGCPDGHFLNLKRYENSEDIVRTPVPNDGDVRQTLLERKDLLNLFLKTIDERGAATLHTRKRCETIDDLEKGVRINFRDGTTAEADFVVASDGIHSAVRKQFAVHKTFYSGFIAYRALVPKDQLPKWYDFYEHSNSWIAKKRHFLAYPVTGSDQISIVAYVNRTEEEIAGIEESWTTLCDKSIVKRDFEGFDHAVQQIIDLMPEQIPRWKINEHEPLDTWAFLNGKVALLGDSAHAMSPTLGAGAGQALEDSYILGRALTDYLASNPAPFFKTLGSTLGLYQMIRAPGAKETQMMSRIAGNTYELMTPDMVDKSYEECLPIFAKLTEQRMKWIVFLYQQDLDKVYSMVRAGADIKAMAAAMKQRLMQAMAAGGPDGMPPKGMMMKPGMEGMMKPGMVLPEGMKPGMALPEGMMKPEGVPPQQQA